VWPPSLFFDVVIINTFAENLCFPSQRSRSGPRRGSCSCATCDWQSSRQFRASRSTSCCAGDTSVSRTTDRNCDTRVEWWDGRCFLRSELLRILLWSSSSNLTSVVRSFTKPALYLSLDVVGFMTYFAPSHSPRERCMVLIDPGDESHPTSRVYIIDIRTVFKSVGLSSASYSLDFKSDFAVRESSRARS